jgi:hypothetical protein
VRISRDAADSETWSMRKRFFRAFEGHSVEFAAKNKLVPLFCSAFHLSGIVKIRKMDPIMKVIHLTFGEKEKKRKGV